MTFTSRISAWVAVIIFGVSAVAHGTQVDPAVTSGPPSVSLNPPLTNRIIIIYDDPAIPDTISNRFEWAWTVMMGDSLGYDIGKWRTLRDGLPSKSFLENYDAVVWSTTEDVLMPTLDGAAADRSCLTPDEEALLDDYLRNPSPGVRPALLVESLDYLNELVAEGGLSPFADSTFMFDEVRFEDYPLATSVRPICNIPGTVTFDLQGFGFPNRTDSYEVDNGVKIRYIVSGTDHIVSHVVTKPEYRAGFTSNLLVALQPDAYPNDRVTYVRRLLTALGAAPSFSVDASLDTLRGAPGDTLQWETTIINGMLSSYGDNSPGSGEQGFGVYPVLTGGEPLGFDKVSIPRIDPGEVLVVNRELVIPPTLDPDVYLFHERLGYAQIDTVRVGRVTLVVE